MKMFSGSDGWDENPIEQVYVLEKLWIDSLENRDTHGYEAIGVFLKERYVELWLDVNQEYWGTDKCWSLGDKTPLYRFYKLKVM